MKLAIVTPLVSLQAVKYDVILRQSESNEGLNANEMDTVWALISRDQFRFELQLVS